jgi:hypothetical protein
MLAFGSRRALVALVIGPLIVGGLQSDGTGR